MELEFKVGEKLVYPNHGVAVVEEIGESPIMGGATYYHMRLLLNNSRLMVPVSSVDKVGLRRLIQLKKVKGLFGLLQNPETRKPDEWKVRYRENLERMKTGRLEDVVVVVVGLYEISRNKTLSFREKKMYDRAKYLLISEVAIVMGMTEIEIEKLLGLLLERPKCPDCRTTMIRGRRGLECTYCNAGAMHT